MEVLSVETLMKATPFHSRVEIEVNHQDVRTHVEPGDCMQELRAPAVKGMMRYVWRSIQDPQCFPEEMRKREAELFGMILNNDTYKSPVSMKIESMVKKEGHSKVIFELPKGNNMSEGSQYLDKWVKTFLLVCYLASVGRNPKNYRHNSNCTKKR
ncbi:hypothetical protein G4V62_06430 [Bacillaceae bacterium SIJ1]|uniref:hypothetical protein n=1 Tax=Litoribacterium kuwaitense TaxID=1398745 RepID=UPI0013EA6403|nr:hypothetical protein [Litoribacterium kuwaitense]NGP44610.1 hypothetical protein [Litoribacterium kuwaitense]